MGAENIHFRTEQDEQDDKYHSATSLNDAPNTDNLLYHTNPPFLKQNNKEAENNRVKYMSDSFFS